MHTYLRESGACWEAAILACWLRRASGSIRCPLVTAAPSPTYTCAYICNIINMYDSASGCASEYVSVCL